MIHLTLFTALVVSAYGAPSMPTKMCIPPDELQGLLVDVSKPIGDYATVFVRDAKQRKEGYAVLPLQGGQAVAQGLIDYQNDVKYDAILVDTPSCEVGKPENPFVDFKNYSQSIENLKYLGATTLGPLATGIPYDAWQFELKETNISMTIALSRDKCIPLLSCTTYVQGAETVIFNQVETTISQTTLLVKPSICP